LSRSTLLYYDRIGVLRASTRSASGYRRYSPENDQRLARICRYRKAGLPLATIATLLDAPDSDLSDALVRQLDLLNEEVLRTRRQQRFILDFLRSDRAAAVTHVITGDQFVELLKLAGVSGDQRGRLHTAFERSDAGGHQAFLEFLCFGDEEIALIRNQARE
jgi:DNA-binding transcriptional MerR regulator